MRWLAGATSLRPSIRAQRRPHAELLLELALPGRECHARALTWLWRLLGLRIRAGPQEAEDTTAGLPVLSLWRGRRLLRLHRWEAIARLSEARNGLVATLSGRNLSVRNGGLSTKTGRRSVAEARLRP